jgi:hypothetical protein
VVAQYIVAAIPVLLPLIFLSSVGDPAVLRVLLWKGNIAVLFISVVPAMLPLLAGSLTFLFAYHLAKHDKYRSARRGATIASLLAWLFGPVGLASTQTLAFLGMLFILDPRRRGLRARIKVVTISAIAVIALSATFVVAANSWDYRKIGLDAVPRAITGRILYGLPQEVVVEEDGRVGYYYVVGVDDLDVTVITGYPNSVRYIKNSTIVGRIACRRQVHFNEIRVLDEIWNSGRTGDTPYCESVAACIRKFPIAFRLAAKVLNDCSAKLPSGEPGVAQD